MDRKRGRFTREDAQKELERRGVWRYVEPILTMGSAAIAEPVSGLVGLTALPYGADASARAIANTQEAMTYQPRTEDGQQGLQDAAEFMQPVGDAFIGASEYLGDAAYNATGSPALGAAAYSIPTMALEALGLKGARYASKGRTAYEMGDIGTQASKYGGKQRGIFAGVKAKGADLKQMEAAQELANRGVSRDEIWSKTGWFEDVDGKWKFEIDDSGFNLDPTKPKDSEFGFKTSKGEVFDHAGLKQAHPELTGENMNVSFEPQLNSGGSYSKISESKILGAPREHFVRIKDPASPRLNNADDMKRLAEKIGEWTKPDAAQKLANEYGIPIEQARAELAEDVASLTQTMKKLRNYDGSIEFYNGSKSTAIHELQHGVQELEGFARGGTPYDFARGNVSSTSHIGQSIIDDIDDVLGSEAFQAERRVLRQKGLSRSEAKQVLYEKYGLNEKLDRVYEIEDNLRSMTDFERYQRLAGEAEARNVQTRLDYTPEQRRATPPWETLDVPEDELIVRRGNGVAMSITPQDALKELEARGIDMSTEARLQRARDMGFDTDQVYYHGTEAEFDSFDLDKVGSKWGADDDGFFFATKEDTAKFYGKTKPYHLSTKNPLMITPENPEFAHLAPWSSDGLTELWDYEGADLVDIAKSRGHDSIIIKNLVDEGDTQEAMTVVFKPEQIRSINAAFNPEHSASANIMKGVGAAGLGLGYMSQEDETK